MDNAKAIAAVAHTLARLSHTRLTKGDAYLDQVPAYHEERDRSRAPPIGATRAETRTDAGRQ